MDPQYRPLPELLSDHLAQGFGDSVSFPGGNIPGSDIWLTLILLPKKEYLLQIMSLKKMIVEAQRETLKDDDKTGKRYLLLGRETGEMVENLGSGDCTNPRVYLSYNIDVHFI